MRMPFRWLRGGRDTSAEGLETIRSLFSKFRRIQKLNTKVLELMAEMDRALGGEYIFDRAFLESSVRELSDQVYQVVYSLTALSQNRYLGLFDRFQTIKSILDDILCGGFGPFASSFTLPYPTLGWEMEPLVGILNVCLAEARHRFMLSAPDGFAVTVTGCRCFLEDNALFWKWPQGANRQALESLFIGAKMPQALEDAVELETKALLERCAVGTRLSVRACSAGGYGTDQPDLKGVQDVPPEEVLRACKLALAEYAAGSGDRAIGETAVALAVHESVPVHIVGTVSSMDAKCPAPGTLFVTASPVESPQEVECYWLKRNAPFDLVQSDIIAKPVVSDVHHGVKSLSFSKSGLYRGSAFVGPTFLKSIAQSAMTIERMLGFPHELRWGRDGQGRPVILSVRPVQAKDEPEDAAENLSEALRNADLIMKDGETVQAGVAIGRTVHVTEDDPAEGFPYGAIAVARKASPRLSPLLRRVSAIVTEIGTPAGHLATIARELRVPAIFGAKEALKLLTEGIQVTVDAGDQSVYRGSVESLLACRMPSSELYPADPEYVMLRGLLRWIMPLNLIDPESKDFSVENCRTYHDIIHFAHERSVEELIHIQERHRVFGNLRSCRLELDAPIELFLIDVDRDVEERSGEAIDLSEVTSKPFIAFIKGLALKDIWNRQPAAISIRDIFSGLDRTYTAMTKPPEYAGKNMAILAREYMNLSLHLGYHSSIVDTYLCDNINQNYIYFRFVGGFGDEKRRHRRVELINNILERMGFKTTVKGDLVVGKFRIADRNEMASALTNLGELTGFTRQLDISMVSENSVEDYVKEFMAKTRFHLNANLE
jgi:pyruvate,water dikinase